MIGAFAVLIASIWIKKAKGDYKFKPRDYTLQQKIWQGKIKKKNIQLVDLKKELLQNIQTKKVVSIKGETKLLHC